MLQVGKGVMVGERGSLLYGNEIICKDLGYCIFVVVFKIYFIFGCVAFSWLRCVFVAAHRLFSSCGEGGCSSLRCVGFSLWWLLLLQSMGSRRVGFSSCGMQAQ